MINKTKADILKLAIELFYKNGITNTTILEIAFKAKIDKKTFHEYFKTKDDVINEYMKNHFEMILLKMNEELIQYPSNKKKIFFLVECLFLNLSSNKEFLFLLVEFIRLVNNKKNETLNSLKVYYEKYQALINQCIEDGIEENEFISCNPVVISFELISKIVGDLILLETQDIASNEYSTLLHVEAVLKTIETKKHD